MGAWDSIWALIKNQAVRQTTVLNPDFLQTILEKLETRAQILILQRVGFSALQERLEKADTELQALLAQEAQLKALFLLSHPFQPTADADSSRSSLDSPRTSEESTGSTAALVDEAPKSDMPSRFTRFKRWMGWEEQNVPSEITALPRTLGASTSNNLATHRESSTIDMQERALANYQDQISERKLLIQERCSALLAKARGTLSEDILFTPLIEELSAAETTLSLLEGELAFAQEEQKKIIQDKILVCQKNIQLKKNEIFISEFTQQSLLSFVILFEKLKTLTIANAVSILINTLLPKTKNRFKRAFLENIRNYLDPTEQQTGEELISEFLAIFKNSLGNEFAKILRVCLPIEESEKIDFIENCSNPEQNAYYLELEEKLLNVFIAQQTGLEALLGAPRNQKYTVTEISDFLALSVNAAYVQDKSHVLSRLKTYMDEIAEDRTSLKDAMMLKRILHLLVNAELPLSQIIGIFLPNHETKNIRTLKEFSGGFFDILETIEAMWPELKALRESITTDASNSGTEMAPYSTIRVDHIPLFSDNLNTIAQDFSETFEMVAFYKEIIFSNISSLLSFIGTDLSQLKSLFNTLFISAKKEDYESGRLIEASENQLIKKSDGTYPVTEALQFLDTQITSLQKKSDKLVGFDPAEMVSGMQVFRGILNRPNVPNSENIKIALQLVEASTQSQDIQTIIQNAGMGTFSQKFRAFLDAFLENTLIGKTPAEASLLRERHHLQWSGIFKGIQERKNTYAKKITEIKELKLAILAAEQFNPNTEEKMVSLNSDLNKLCDFLNHDTLYMPNGIDIISHQLFKWFLHLQAELEDCHAKKTVLEREQLEARANRAGSSQDISTPVSVKKDELNNELLMKSDWIIQQMNLMMGFYGALLRFTPLVLTFAPIPTLAELNTKTVTSKSDSHFMFNLLINFGQGKLPQFASDTLFSSMLSGLPWLAPKTEVMMCQFLNTAQDHLNVTLFNKVRTQAPHLTATAQYMDAKAIFESIKTNLETHQGNPKYKAVLDAMKALERYSIARAMETGQYRFGFSAQDYYLRQNDLLTLWATLKQGAPQADIINLIQASKEKYKGKGFWHAIRRLFGLGKRQRFVTELTRFENAYSQLDLTTDRDFLNALQDAAQVLHTYHSPVPSTITIPNYQNPSHLYDEMTAYPNRIHLKTGKVISVFSQSALKLNPNKVPQNQEREPVLNYFGIPLREAEKAEAHVLIVRGKKGFQY